MAPYKVFDEANGLCSTKDITSCATALKIESSSGQLKIIRVLLNR